MSPNGLSSGFDEIFSSDSSDFEFLSHRDVKNCENQINKQWEAIERTLYQESGQQVTDPELLKECKLWRETFPHFRVRGTKIEVKKQENKAEETDKHIQTFENHFNLKVLEEKRESIKKKVVGVLVERLIAKYGLEKEGSTKLERNHSSGVQITEIDDETAEKMSNPSPGSLKQAENYDFPTVATVKNESYFERGKPMNKDTLSPKEGLTAEQMEKKFCEIFDSWAQNDETAFKLPETFESAHSKKAANSPRENLVLRNSIRSSSERSKPRKFIPPFDSLSSLAKPFEMSKKIDKKYEGLIEKIMERQYNGLDPRRHCRTSSSGLENCQETLGRLRISSRLDNHERKRSLPRLNKFSNPWLDRSELDSYHNSAGDHTFHKKINKFKGASESQYPENISQREIDERFLEELKKEMALNYKRPPKKSGVIEEINLRRPKPFASTPEMSVKPAGFGDLTKRNKKDVRGGLLKRGVEPRLKDSNLKNCIKSNIPNAAKGNKTNGNQNFLPPFETGIICTELTGRPKIGPKNLSKRY